jgi:hypothetical protein
MLHLPEKLISDLTNGISLTRYYNYPCFLKFSGSTDCTIAQEIPKCETFKELFDAMGNQDLPTNFLKYLYANHKETFIDYTCSLDCEAENFFQCKSLTQYFTSTPLGMLAKLLENCIERKVEPQKYARYTVYCFVAAIYENADSSIVNYYVDLLEQVLDTFNDTILVIIYGMLCNYDLNLFIRFMNSHPLTSSACRSILFDFIKKVDFVEYMILTQTAEIFTPHTLAMILQHHCDNHTIYEHFINNMPPTKYNIINTIYILRLASEQICKTNIEFILCTYPHLIDLNGLHEYDLFGTRTETTRTFLSGFADKLSIFELFVSHGADLDNKTNVVELVSVIPYTCIDICGQRQIGITTESYTGLSFNVKHYIMTNAVDKYLWQEKLNDFIIQLRTKEFDSNADQKVCIGICLDIKDFFQHFEVKIMKSSHDQQNI